MAGAKREADREADRADRPRTDLPPRKLPYDEDYFGSGEEEGVTREREITEREGEPSPDRKSPPA